MINTQKKDSGFVFVEDDMLFKDPRFDDVVNDVGVVYKCPYCGTGETALFFKDTKDVLSFRCSCGYRGIFVYNKGVFGRTSSVWEKQFQ